jgi:hypothetical protein
MGTAALPASQTIPYFGRAWSIKIMLQAGGTILLTSQQDDQPIRVVFTVRTQVLLSYFDATITIYNANLAVMDSVLQATQQVPAANITTLLSSIILGDNVSISAGYKYGANGAAFDPLANLIYQGNVFQPMWTRENVVDWKLTIRCLIGYQQDKLNPVQFVTPPNKTALDKIYQLSGASGLPIGVIDDQSKKVLSQNPMSRSEIINKNPLAVMRDTMSESKLVSWLGPNGLNIRSFNFDPNTTPDIIYEPPGTALSSAQSAAPIKTTLLGVPEQTQEGIAFRVLLDPQVKLGNIVQVPSGLSSPTGVATNQFPNTIGQYNRIPNPTGLYAVYGIKHYGDSRGKGQDWYTEIIGVTAGFYPNFLLPTNPNVVTG